MTLTADEVWVRFGSAPAVAGATIELAPGQLLAVTGPSGAGKTSLLHALAGVHPAAGGRIALDGRPLAGRDEAVASGIVLIPQGNALLRVMTALENVAAPLVARHRREARDRAEQALAAVGLDEAGDQLPEELSGGQQQRVAVARGLALAGRYLLADEPTSELDAANRVRVVGLLRAEAQRGAGVLMATHDPAAAELCDAEWHMDEGRLQLVRG